LGLVILHLACSHAILWGAGLLPVGTFDSVIGFGVVYGPYTFAVLAYLNGVARRALRSFWPATGWPDSDRSSWAYALTTSPSGYGPAIIGVGVVMAVAAFVAVPSAVVP